MIEFNISSSRSELPSITIENPRLKLLIDTGSTKSFNNSDLAKKYYSKFILKEQFTVSTFHQTSTQDSCANIPIFSEFKHNDNSTYSNFMIFIMVY